MNYAEQLGHYREFVLRAGFQETFATGRIEAQFESLRDWSAAGDMAAKRAWFLEQRDRCTMRVEDIPLNDCRGWLTDPVTGNITHESGDFFMVQGVRVTLSADREVTSGWDQPILTQIGYDGGLLGILRQRINGIPHYLFEAKAEPGNYGLVLLSPTLQATFSNLKRAHGGKKPRFAEFFETPEQFPVQVLFSNWMSEDGGCLHKKRNYGMLVELDPAYKLDFPGTFAWFSLWQIKEFLKEDAWVNPHIRGIISHL